MNKIAIIGIFLSALGTIFMVSNWIEISKNLIERIWPKWKEIERAVTYFEENKFLTIYEREIFIPFQKYFYEKVRDQGIFGFRLLDHIIRYSSVSKLGSQTFEKSGPNWDNFIREFDRERDLFLKRIESKIIIIGAILVIIGLFLTIIE